MSQDNKKYKRIRAEDAAELLGWDLPHMSGPITTGLERKESSDDVQVVEEEFAAEKITVSELESIRENARLEGLAAGLEEGRELGLSEGKQQGLKEGKEQGFQQGLKSGSAELQRVKALLEGAAEELVAPLKLSTDKVEAVLLDLVIRISEAVVKHELSSNKELLLESIQSALRQMPEPLNSVELKVNPVDQAYIDLSSFVVDAGLTVIADEALTPGGFTLRTQATLVQDLIEERFSQVVSQLLDGLNIPETAESNEQDT